MSLTDYYGRVLGICVVLVFFGSTITGLAVEPAAKELVAEKEAKLELALKKLNLPGVTVNIKERCVDVASSVCIKGGVLEFVACTKGTKEHESLVAIEALPKHVHTALLLIGAKSGSPATRKSVDKERTRWVNVPPSGDEVGVYLLIDKGDGVVVELPISDFIERVDEEGEAQGRKMEGDEHGNKFPTHTFLFAGSGLNGSGDAPRTYLADVSGNVISVATFGDELLCLPGINSHTSGALMWQVNSKNIPPVGTKVTLRLRPKL